MKFSTINKLAHDLSNQFPRIQPSWTVDDAVHLLSTVEGNTKKKAAIEIYELFKEDYGCDEEFEDAVSLDEFLSSI